MGDVAERITLMLHELKVQRGINQSQVAQALGLKKSAVNKWASGATSSPTAENLFMLEDLFGYSARWLATGEGPRYAAQVREKAAEYAIHEKVENGDLLDLSALPAKARTVVRATVHALEQPEDDDPVNPKAAAL